MAFGTPRERNLALISPAAFAVKVSAKTFVGSVTPALIAYAIRLVITRVFPVPAPAITQTGPVIAFTTAS